MSKRKRKKRKKQQLEFEEFLDQEQDATFFYIAGYTSGGAPYGITWEEAREEGLIDESKESKSDDCEDLPF